MPKNHRKNSKAYLATQLHLILKKDDLTIFSWDFPGRHEDEIEQLTQTIDSLQEQLDEAMKSRLTMITRQVREVKNVEDEIRQMKRQLDNFDRYARYTH